MGAEQSRTPSQTLDEHTVRVRDEHATSGYALMTSKGSDFGQFCLLVEELLDIHGDVVIDYFDLGVDLDDSSDSSSYSSESDGSSSDGTSPRENGAPRTVASDDGSDQGQDQDQEASILMRNLNLGADIAAKTRALHTVGTRSRRAQQMAEADVADSASIRPATTTAAAPVRMHARERELTQRHGTVHGVVSSPLADAAAGDTTVWVDDVATGASHSARRNQLRRRPLSELSGALSDGDCGSESDGDDYAGPRHMYHNRPNRMTHESGGTWLSIRNEYYYDAFKAFKIMRERDVTLYQALISGALPLSTLPGASQAVSVAVSAWNTAYARRLNTLFEARRAFSGRAIVYLSKQEHDDEAEELKELMLAIQKEEAALTAPPPTTATGSPKDEEDDGDAPRSSSRPVYGAAAAAARAGT